MFRKRFNQPIRVQLVCGDQMTIRRPPCSAHKFLWCGSVTLCQAVVRPKPEVSHLLDTVLGVESIFFLYIVCFLNDSFHHCINDDWEQWDGERLAAPALSKHHVHPTDDIQGKYNFELCSANSVHSSLITCHARISVTSWNKILRFKWWTLQSSFLHRGFWQQNDCRLSKKTDSLHFFHL